MSHVNELEIVLLVRAVVLERREHDGIRLDPVIRYKVFFAFFSKRRRLSSEGYNQRET